MRNAENDWINGCRLDEAWWDVMSDKQQSEYRRKEDDRARHYIRHSALLTLFDYIYNGTIKVTAHKTFTLGGKTSEVVYLKKSYFLDFSIIDANKLMKLEFNGSVYEDLRVTFPKDWTDGETYEAAPEKNDDEMIAVAANDDEALASIPKKRGRPTNTPEIDQALADLHQEHGDVIF